jgi:hypothetical protein
MQCLAIPIYCEYKKKEEEIELINKYFWLNFHVLKDFPLKKSNFDLKTISFPSLEKSIFSI